MKKILILLAMVLPLIATAQQTSSREKKAAKKREQHDKIVKLIESKTFVMQAHTIRTRRGRNTFVSPSTNFVAITDSTGVVQIATNNFSPGFNGLGGETVTGRIKRMGINDKGPGKGVSVRMNFIGLASFDFFLDVSDGGFATLRLSGNQGQYFTFSGDVRPLQGSGIFIGNTTY